MCPGSIYDFYFLKQGGGHWCTWTEYITKEEETIPAHAKVKESYWPRNFGNDLISRGTESLEGLTSALLRTYFRKRFKHELAWPFKSMDLRIRETQIPYSAFAVCAPVYYTIAEKILKGWFQRLKTFYMKMKHTLGARSMPLQFWLLSLS